MPRWVIRVTRGVESLNFIRESVGVVDKVNEVQRVRALCFQVVGVRVSGFGVRVLGLGCSVHCRVCPPPGYSSDHGAASERGGNSSAVSKTVN